MTAVIMGLVAVVLLVLVVVALGMRSMNRRESALSSERLKAMAENKGPKPRRPAEETFFESFPQGFDAFEENSDKEKTAAKPRPAAKPGGRQAARPAQRSGGKQPAAPRGRRGVDEWGESDDYDDDYWSRVRADDGGFSGPGARPATPRPAGRPAGDAPANAQAATPSRATDPDAVTVQAPLPLRAASDRPSGRKRATPASAAAEQKTVAFSAPTPDVLGGLGTPASGRSQSSPSGDAFDASPSTGSFDAIPSAASFDASPATGSFSTAPSAASFDASPATGSFGTAPAGDAFTPPSRPSGSASSRSGRSGRSSRSARRSAASSADTGAGRAGGSFEAPLGTGPLAGGFDATSSQAPAAGSYGTGTGSFETNPATGPYPTGTGSFDAPAPGSYNTGTGSFGPAPAPGLYTTGTGPFETLAPAPAPGTPAPDPLTSATPSAPGTGSFDSWTAYEAPQSNDSYDLPPGSSGLFTTADTGPSYTVPPTVPPVTPIPPTPAPPAPSETSWPATPAASPSWSGVRDIFDDPEPARGGGSNTTWPSVESYQQPAAQQPGYDGYSSYQNDPGYSTGTSSYEVSAGWATIEDADSAAGPTGAPTGPGHTVSPYESAGYDVPSGQSPYGYDQQQGQPGGNGPQSWPEPEQQNAGGSWPSYDELYGTAQQSTSSRRGSHRQPDSEPDYPDYYR
ncbi:hypothetical protein [Planotetraspora kaengkrachanensis]|uniref:Uncharacterized protein n=1 Tax=Planotetraspora kaengkrachanensis TaxID=575193 RepID=A0A8J3PS22_9ACTN|nr:hypothetical protein [Planotetraspora kaengkrachanensis]GIG79802.1 hypothetical protein Pka01_29290 [Planotetraspora kaengkrachanensis]